MFKVGTSANHGWVARMEGVTFFLKESFFFFFWKTKKFRGELVEDGGRAVFGGGCPREENSFFFIFGK